MSWVPDACTLPPAEVPLRVAEFRELFARALRGVARPRPGLLRLALDAGEEATARDLIARETACCSFFDVTVDRDGDRLRVDVAVPAGQEPVLDAIARLAAASREPA